MAKKVVGQIASDTLRRFPDVPINTLAKYLCHVHDNVFLDVEKARTTLRYYTGRIGSVHRKNASDKSMFRTEAVGLPQTKRLVTHPYDLKPGSWLVLSDAHIPYHEQKPLETAVQYGQTEQVTGILLNGDWQDCAALSYWPQMKRDFPAEVEAVIDSLDWLRSEFPDAEIVYKPGNHEDRLQQYYMSRAPELIGLPTSDMETILSLEKRGIRYLERKQKVMAGKLPILHGHELRGGNQAVNPARWLFLKTKSSAAASHHHRTSSDNKTNVKGELLSTWSFGCLCDLNPDYSPECNDWNWGFAVIHIEKDGDFQVDNRRILSTGKVV